MLILTSAVALLRCSGPPPLMSRAFPTHEGRGTTVMMNIVCTLYKVFFVMTSLYSKSHVQDSCCNEDALYKVFFG